MRFRPHFSIRTLLVLVTLVGGWFGGIELTRRFGVKQVGRSIKGRAGIDWHNNYLTGRRSHSTNIPFVVASDSTPTTWNAPTPAGWAFRREYYVWFLGLTFKLPFERRLVNAADDVLE